MNKKAKKKYSWEFKKEAVMLVTEQGYKIAGAARNLGIRSNMLGRGKREIEEEKTEGRLGLGSDEQIELKRLRDENRRLKMEREILKKAAAFFANETR